MVVSLHVQYVGHIGHVLHLPMSCMHMGVSVHVCVRVRVRVRVCPYVFVCVHVVRMCSCVLGTTSLQTR